MGLPVPGNRYHFPKLRSKIKIRDLQAKKANYPRFQGEIMFREDDISVSDFIMAISEAIDLASPALSSHHKKTAYIACKLAMEMNLPDDEIKDIALAAILHDIGAFSLEERFMLQSLRMNEKDLVNHAELGYKLLGNFEPLKKIADLIRYHHTNYDNMGQEVPVGSYVIHLADKISVLPD
jgi:response regulator RpfG family c-di-GMP phosphodiesterase